MTPDPDNIQELEARLLAAAERAQRLFDSSQNGILVIDGETGSILEANPAVCNLLGFTSGELKAKKLWEICPSADIPSQQVLFRQMQNNATSLLAGLVLEARGGLAHHLDCTYSSYVENTRRIILCNLLDSSALQIENKQLQATADHYRTLTESMKDVIWVLDAETLYFRYVSPSVERLRGYTPQEICALPMDYALIPAEVAHLKELIRERINFYLAHPNEPSTFYTEQVAQPCKDGSFVSTEVITTFSRNPESGRMEIHGVTRDITDRKRAEEILSESENRYHSLFDNMQEGVALHRLLFDENGQPVDYLIEDINPSYEKGVGITADQAKGKPASQVYGVSPAPYLDIFSRVAQTGQPYFFETYFAPLDRHYEISVISTRKNWFATIFLDVSARKRAEEAASQKGDLLQMTGFMAKVGGWEYDIETSQYTWTDETTRIFELDPKMKIDERVIISFYTADSRKKIAHSRAEALATAKPYDLELEMISGSGRLKTVRVLGNPILQHGKVVKIRGIIQDISEQVEARQARLESEQLYQQLFELSPIPLCSINIHEEFTYFNKRFTTVFGYTPADLQSMQDWWRLVYPDPSYRQEVINRWKFLVQNASQGNGVIEPADYVITCKDSSKRTVSITGTIIKNGLLVSLFDVTESRQAAEELEHQRLELTRSNAELEQFAYVTSHDLQEPLRMVTSYVQLLARRYKGRLDPNADEFINYAVDGTQRMQRLINDLLTYSRVSTRGVTFTPVACNAIIDQVLENLRVSITEHNATVTFDPLPIITADELQLGQLFQNLISNALKFHDTQPVRIHISAEAHPGEWIFSVKDNGIGIDPQYAERIFVIFQRLHTSTEYPGTGIGLAICKKIVERHGGRIWVKSELHKGATFYFSMPA